MLPDNAKQPRTRGRVVAVGPGNVAMDGKSRIPMDFKVDDDVLYWPGAAGVVQMDNEELVLVPACEVLGVYED